MWVKAPSRFAQPSVQRDTMRYCRLGIPSTLKKCRLRNRSLYGEHTNTHYGYVPFCINPKIEDLYIFIILATNEIIE